MAHTRLSFSEMGVTSSQAPKRKIMRFPVLWILNPETGRCKRFDHFELKDQITKKNYRGIAESAEFVVVITDSRYYSFSSNNGSLIKAMPKAEISGRIVGVQAEGILFRDGNKLILRDKELNETAGRELTPEEVERLDR